MNIKKVFLTTILIIFSSALIIGGIYVYTGNTVKIENYFSNTENQTEDRSNIENKIEENVAQNISEDDLEIIYTEKKYKQNGEDKIEKIKLYGIGDTAVYFWDYNENIKVLKTADSESFEVISKEYSRDKDNVYYLVKSCFGCMNNQPEVIKDLDTQSIRVITDSIITDDNYVYYGTEKVSVSNPKELKSMNNYYLEDGENVYSTSYYNLKKLEGENPENFVILSERYAKGKEAIYFDGSILDASAKKFIIVDEYVGYDDENIFFIKPSGYEFSTCVVTRPFKGEVKKVSDQIYQDSFGQKYAYSFETDYVNGGIIKPEPEVDVLYDEFNCQAG